VPELRQYCREQKIFVSSKAKKDDLLTAVTKHVELLKHEERAIKHEEREIKHEERETKHEERETKREEREIKHDPQNSHSNFQQSPSQDEIPLILKKKKNHASSTFGMNHPSSSASFNIPNQPSSTSFSTNHPPSSTSFSANHPPSITSFSTNHPPPSASFNTSSSHKIVKTEPTAIKKSSTSGLVSVKKEKQGLTDDSIPLCQFGKNCYRKNSEVSVQRCCKPSSIDLIFFSTSKSIVIHGMIRFFAAGSLKAHLYFLQYYLGCQSDWKLSRSSRFVTINKRRTA